MNYPCKTTKTSIAYQSVFKTLGLKKYSSIFSTLAFSQLIEPKDCNYGAHAPFLKIQKIT